MGQGQLKWVLVVAVQLGGSFSVCSISLEVSEVVAGEILKNWLGGGDTEILCGSKYDLNPSLLR